MDMKRLACVGVFVTLLVSIASTGVPSVGATLFENGTLPVNDVTVGNQMNASIAVGSDGVVHVVWEDYRAGPNDPDIAENGWSTDTTGPGSTNYADQKDHYVILTALLKQYYWSGGGKAGGFLGILWYELFDALYDDSAWFWPDTIERNFGLVETPEEMSSAGGYGAGESPKDAWIWLRDDLGP